MRRPANPQAMARSKSHPTYTGHPELGREVDVDTWLTPRWILQALGPFDLDPCAAEECPTWTGCGRSFVKSTDGLIQPWQGRVFMNPPYSDVAPWLLKHSLHGPGGVSLVPASVESRMWREFVWPRARGILLLSGRTRFSNPDGSVTTGRPLCSVALIGWGSYDAGVLACCQLAGVFLDSWRLDGLGGRR